MPAAIDNMSAAKRFMRQKCVLWPISGNRDNYGQHTYGTPEEIDCRWDEVTEEFIDEMGDKQLSRARLIVDRDLSLGDKLKLCFLDSDVNDDPSENEDVWIVRSFLKTPNVKGNKFLREVLI